jgi:hypothetical protein
MGAEIRQQEKNDDITYVAGTSRMNMTRQDRLIRALRLLVIFLVGPRKRRFWTKTFLDVHGLETIVIFGSSERIVVLLFSGAPRESSTKSVTNKACRGGNYSRNAHGLRRSSVRKNVMRLQRKEPYNEALLVILSGKNKETYVDEPVFGRSLHRHLPSSARKGTDLILIYLGALRKSCHFSTRTNDVRREKYHVDSANVSPPIIGRSTKGICICR